MRRTGGTHIGRNAHGSPLREGPEHGPAGGRERPDRGRRLTHVAHRRARPDRTAGHRQAGLFLCRRRHRSKPRGIADCGPHVCGNQVPQRLAHPYPVVMIHGGSQTGTNFTGTPDGRDGWAQYFLRRGYAVYVVDQVARGRAAQWSQANGPVTAANIARLEQRFVAPERFGLWPQAHLHTQWPGTGKPGDPSFDQFYASQFPSLADFPLQQALNRDAVVALIDRIGPAVLLVHSQSGAFAWPIADKRPGLVKAIIAIEPNGPPAHDVEFKGAPDWFGDNPHVKPYGLVDVPLTYDPPVSDAAPLKFAREDKPERPDYVRCWAQSEPARKLVNLQNTPILIVTSEASYHAPYDHCTV